MADDGKVVIELVGKDSATQTFVKSMQDMAAGVQKLESIGVRSAGYFSAIEKNAGLAGSRSAASLSAIEKSAMLAGNAVGSMTTRLLALASVSTVGYGISRGFQAAIKSIDTFQTNIIQIASTLTSLSEKGQGGIGEQFNRNLAYAEQMYRAINVESAKHFASAHDMMTVYNRLTQEGYGVRLQEVNALGQLADLIKMYTGDQQLEKQLNQEIRSLMNGQARATDAMTMSLKAQLGDGWAKLVNKHKEAGDLLQWIVSLYPGLDAATGKITQTWSAQYATTKSLLELLSINGLGGAYQQIVNYLIQCNDYLRVHGDELEGRVQKAWENVSPIVFGIANSILNAADGALQLADNLDKITQNRGLMMVFGVLAGSRLGPVGAVAGGLAGLGISQTLSNDAEVKRGLERSYRKTGEFGGYEEPYLQSLGYKAEPAGPTKLRKPPPEGGKGGGGKDGGGSTDSAEASLKSFVDTMTQETARAAGDTEAILTAWFGKQSATLDKLAAKGLDVTTGKQALDAAYYSKLQKLDADFADWYSSGLGNQYDLLVAQERKKLAEVAGNKAKEAQVIEVFDRKHFDLSQQMETERVNLFKGYLDTMANLSPVLADQLGYKRQALDYELKLADAALERSRREGKITQDTYDQAQGLAAVVAQAKKLNLEMENDKGLQGWAYARVKSDQQKNTWADAMSGLESFVNDAWTQGTQGALSKTKVDYMEVAKTMAQSFILNMGKQGITWGFGQIAKGFLGDKAGQLGTESNPMVVTIKGAGLAGTGAGAGGASDFAKRAGKIGYTMGGDHSWEDQAKQLKTYDKLYDQMMKGQTKDWKMTDKLSDNFWKDNKKNATTYSKMQDEMADQNQDLFKAEYLTSYQDSFTGMATGITGVWGLAQGIMTAAGVSGEAQRYATMAQYGIQGISLITQLAKGKVLVDAAKAAAAGYASVMEVLPWPINLPIAVAWGALAFAGTMAAGAIKSSAGGDYQVATTGPRYVHQDETILPSWAADSWRNIVNREASGSASSGGSNQLVNVGGITIHINNPSKDFDADKLARKLVPALQKQIVNNRLRPNQKS